MPHAASEVALMGLSDWLEEPDHGKFSGFSVYTKTAHLRQGVPPHVARSARLRYPPEETDAKLLDRAIVAGAEFQSNTRATGLIRSHTGDITGLEATSDGVSWRFEAPLVIVADGVGGFAGEGMKGPPERRGPSAVLQKRGRPRQRAPPHLYDPGHELKWRGIRLGFLLRGWHGERWGRGLDEGIGENRTQPQRLLRSLPRRTRTCRMVGGR